MIVKQSKDCSVKILGQARSRHAQQRAVHQPAVPKRSPSITIDHCASGVHQRSPNRSGTHRQRSRYQRTGDAQPPNASRTGRNRPPPLPPPKRMRTHARDLTTVSTESAINQYAHRFEAKSHLQALRFKRKDSNSIESKPRPKPETRIELQVVRVRHI